MKSIAYNMYEAKTKLSELVEKARNGIEVVLMNRGEPVARIVPLDRKKRKLGFAKSIDFSEDFNKIPDGFENYVK